MHRVLQRALLSGLLCASCSSSNDSDSAAATDDGAVDSAARDSGASDTMIAGDSANDDGRPDVAPATPAVRFVGRFDTSDAAGPAFEWSGSQVIARFNGTGVSVKLKGNSGVEFAVVIDGGMPTVLKATSTSATTYPLATGLAPGVHTVVLWRRTEAFFGAAQFQGFSFEGGELLAPPAAAPHLLEVIGDSITCGYGADGTNPCSFTADTEDHYATYEALAAHAKNADLITACWSGIGVFRNYPSATPMPEKMPDLYSRTLPTDSASTWDFAKSAPDAVVINLGTNDFASGDPGMPFQDAYLAFARTIRKHYPKAWIFAAVGPMLSGGALGQDRTYLNAVVSKLNGEGDARVSLLEFATQNSADGFGCDYHPNRVTHEKMATALESELAAKLGW